MKKLKLTVTVLALTMLFAVQGKSQETNLDSLINVSLEDARKCFNEGNYACAIDKYKIYQNMVQEIPQSVSSQIQKSEKCKAAISMADGYYSNGDYKNAAKQYHEVCQLNPDDVYAKKRYDFCKEQPDPVSPAKNPVIGGRNISLGITAGIVNTGFSASSNLASIANYGYANEKPSYSSELGFTVGLLLDIRLYKNFYLQTGINYINARVKNSFESSFWYQYYNLGTTLGVDQSLTNTYVEGTAYDKFTEKYEMNYLEIPLLFSYRFKISEKLNWQINIGPYVGYGFSGECKISGSTDIPSLNEYNKNDDTPTGNSYFINWTYNGNLNLFNKEEGKSTTLNTITMYESEYSYNFEKSPFNNINAGISLGTAFEISGFNIGVYYDLGLINIANDEYWSSERMNITRDDAGLRMKNYKHKLNKLQVKIGYIFRW
jgi:hypothetical protein